MRRFPDEFAEILSTRGRRMLAGKFEPMVREGKRFVALNDVVDRRRAREALRLLERTLPKTLERMEEAIPPQAIWGMTRNYSEQLPKAVRVWTALLERRRTASSRAAEELGLVGMLKSESFRQFAQVLCGRPLRRTWGIQVLCYGAGDYSGPHNDHHPEDAEARDGYLDVHLTFANDAVARQLLVYERRGHLSEVAEVRTLGGVTAYRLPFWHYTTPLEGKRGRESDARRWVLLGTFTDARRTGTATAP